MLRGSQYQHHKSSEGQSSREIQDFNRTRLVANNISQGALQQTARWVESHSPVHDDGVPEYLAPFGYRARSATEWESQNGTQGPTLKLGILTKAEVDGHTWYLIQASLAVKGTQGPPVRWRAARRLVHLRQLWYTYVKGRLGDSYNKEFAGARFAHVGGPFGTTQRLHGWCQTLASCISTGRAGPMVVAQTLRFLDAPHSLLSEASEREEAKRVEEPQGVDDTRSSRGPNTVTSGDFAHLCQSPTNSCIGEAGVTTCDVLLDVVEEDPTVVAAPRQAGDGPELSALDAEGPHRGVPSTSSSSTAPSPSARQQPGLQPDAGVGDGMCVGADEEPKPAATPVVYDISAEDIDMGGRLQSPEPTSPSSSSHLALAKVSLKLQL